MPNVKEQTNQVNKPVVELKVKPELKCFGYVSFKQAGNWYTARVDFDENLTIGEFSEKTIAGDEKGLMVERLKILLGSKVF